ncbi:NADH dehydrogenase subunit N [Arcticibacter tournemirensis]|uniref:NADH-quinone oxidoreductase subunit N n=1 Tax=Arcticibacter tournemirensis TaxID=699437 RepID=A0A5M9GQ70_9SPHI|nr:NADH-quinone oxidoreductase subunit N [Arcticibacter tournemirensis]KAA8475877.1 NADH-quinone oxidoreductase subunit N [Arcticibacter tournemirensis]TQM51510.1 NADH dehydrogenase subunit N [Arcticibacter tournemirensis]
MNELLPTLPVFIKDVLSGMAYLIPEIILVATFIVVLLADLFFPGRRSSLAFWLCLTGITASVLFVAFKVPSVKGPALLFGNTLVSDAMSSIFKQIFYAVIVLFAIFIRCNPRVKQHKKGSGDLYILLPAVLLGLNLMSMASSLLLIYLSIEMISISSYLMAGYVSGDDKQTEAAMKYVLFGSACSAIMLYGMSLLYGFTGTLTITDPEFLLGLGEMPRSVVVIAVGLVLVGIGFKLSFVPFHFWSPDVYEGAPVPVTAFLSTGPKIAGFAILIRFLGGFSPQQGMGSISVFDFEGVLSAVAILSMVVGNFVAIWQDNIKRMLAYSSIGHTGFILMAVVVSTGSGLKAMMFYLLIYGLMNMSAFMLAGKIEDQSGAVSIKDYRGLGRFLKIEMVCFVVVLMSLTGLPPLAGFIAKFLVFSAVFESYSAGHSMWMLALLVTGAITTVVSLFYYFKVPLNAFLRQSETTPVITARRDILTYIIIVLTFLILLWGVFPGLLI